MSTNIIGRGQFGVCRYSGGKDTPMYQINVGAGQVNLSQAEFLEMCIEGLRDYVEEK